VATSAPTPATPAKRFSAVPLVLAGRPLKRRTQTAARRTGCARRPYHYDERRSARCTQSATIAKLTRRVNASTRWVT
jgi:hypothetical protein